VRTVCHYRASEEWTLSYGAGHLLVSGGADELFALEDVREEVAGELQAAWAEGVLDPGRLSPDAERILPHLLQLGAAVREVRPRPPKSVALGFVGREDEAFAAALRDEAEGGGRLWTLCGSPTAELTLLVRTNARLVDAYPDGHHVPGCHLFLDAAFHHTISIGPVVFPGETACLGCLSGRIGRVWGDAQPPPRPAVQSNTRFLAAMAALELDKIAGGDLGLVNATVTLDLHRYEVKRNALYRLPWCPACGDRDRGEAVGAIALPWAA
jgi:bacteriocin biosynthesis cyclodehydratase domain-containing protein